MPQVQPGCGKPPLRPPVTTGTDFAAFRREILVPGGGRAMDTLGKWFKKSAKDPEYAAIQNFVCAQDHAVLHTLTVGDVARVASHPDPDVRTGHALGDAETGDLIRNTEAGVKEVMDFATPWSILHLLHGLLEASGRVPRFEDFHSYLREDVKERYYDVFTGRYGYARRSAADIRGLERGFQYRIGNAYYSFLREVDLMTRLRIVHGLPVRYHLLADIQFRIDFWCGNVLVALWISNPKFRQGADGRKQGTADFLDMSAFSLLRLELDRPNQSFARRPVLFSERQVGEAAKSIRKAMESRRN